MELSGKDIQRIDEIMTEYGIEVAQKGFPIAWNSPQFYEEIARRFNTERNP